MKTDRPYAAPWPSVDEPGAEDRPLELDFSRARRAPPPAELPATPPMLRQRRTRFLRAEKNVLAVGAIVMLQAVAWAIAVWTEEGWRGLSTPALVGRSILLAGVIYTAGSLRRLHSWARHATTAGLALWLGSRLIQLQVHGVQHLTEQSVAIGLAVFSLYALREPNAAAVFEREYRELVVPATGEIKAGSALSRIALGLAVGFAILYAALVAMRNHLG